MALDGQVALVTDGGSALGRAIALALAARGVKVVVTGPVERSLGETVGEIAYGGGKARHVVAAPRDPVAVGSALARAVEVFGRLDLVVVANDDPSDVACIRDVATRTSGIAPRVLEPTPAERAMAPEELAQLVVANSSR
ncbi:MAG: SDR family NAD(P)-dependent oxidoreductase [Deltaproteobacteria bacterium]|nr:SDR family NAD(P)-dependent oxidoreductase [Deltaproteobacteria bacterium]